MDKILKYKIHSYIKGPESVTFAVSNFYIPLTYIIMWSKFSKEKPEI